MKLIKIANLTIILKKRRHGMKYSTYESISQIRDLQYKLDEAYSDIKHLERKIKKLETIIDILQSESEKPSNSIADIIE